MSRDVFISHSSAEKPIADRLCRLLEGGGLECWIAPRDIAPGNVWASEIVRGIETCSLFVLLASRSSLGSQQVERELERAVGFNRDLLAIRLDDSNLPESFEYFLESRQWVEWNQGNWDIPVRAIFQALSRPPPDAIVKPPLWDLLDHGALVIVASRWKGQFDDWEPSGLVGYGDTRALIELRGRLEGIGASNVALRFHDNVLADDREANLILLGGPDADWLSRRFLDANSSTTFGWMASEANQVSIVDRRHSKTYSPALYDASTTGTDYGLIVRGSNPDHESRHALLLAGSFGFGTWAAAVTSFSPGLNALDVVAEGRPFEALLKVPVEHEHPVDVEVLEVRELAAAPAS